MPPGNSSSNPHNPPGFQISHGQSSNSQLEGLLIRFIKDSDERQKSVDLILKNQEATLRNHGASNQKL